MHDVLEGAIHVEIKCLLIELIQKQKLFSLRTLNDRISSFPYGDDLSDRPRKFPNTFFTSGSFRNGGTCTFEIYEYDSIVLNQSTIAALFLLLV